jgi:hypothetical protein
LAPVSAGVGGLVVVFGVLGSESTSTSDWSAVVAVLVVVKWWRKKRKPAQRKQLSETLSEEPQECVSAFKGRECDMELNMRRFSYITCKYE